MTVCSRCGLDDERMDYGPALRSSLTQIETLNNTIEDLVRHLITAGHEEEDRRICHHLVTLDLLLVVVLLALIILGGQPS